MGEPPEGDGRYGPAEADGRYGQCLVAIFLLGVVLFQPLLLSVFDAAVAPELGETARRPVMLLGVPLLYAYVFVAWALLIALLALVVERASTQPGPQAGTPREREVE
ncbi:MAG: hypothetical protein U1E66_14265 [Rhodospirillales bacterium]